MNIRDRLETIRTGESYHIMSNIDASQFYKAEVGPIDDTPISSELVRQYELRLMLRMPFHCTTAELHGATESATICMMGNLYGPFIDRLNDLARCTWAGDRRKAISIIEEIKREITS